MRIRLNLLTLLGLGLLALPALAQPPEPPADNPPSGDPAMKQKLLDAFDTNKDGTIDRSEARAIGRALRENFDIGPGPGGRGPEGRRGPAGSPPEDGPAARGPENRRGREPDDWGRGPGAPDNPPPPPRPNPERLFNRFDENKDELLSKDEFKKLTDFMREHRPPGPAMMGRGGPGRGFDGPPRDFDRRGEGRGRGWWRDAPPGPPPSPDGPPPENGQDVGPKDAI